MIAVAAGWGWGERREMVGYCSARDRAWGGGVMDCRSWYTGGKGGVPGLGCWVWEGGSVCCGSDGVVMLLSCVGQG